ncbi:MAG: sigma-70 family RNA polymerase sigma factor [Bacteroidia bacterium]|nr:sigma-70 family RNA polymerase sigma factor [Bacteroidia bacterium]
MADNDLIIALSKNDPQTKRDLFEKQYELMAGIAVRYSKNDAQAKDLMFAAFDNTLQAFLNQRSKSEINFEEFFEKQFIYEAVQFIKAIRSEYYVASTVYAPSDRDKNYNLFDNNEIIDFNAVEMPVLIKSFQELVPSQRLVFNIFVIEGIDILAISEMLEASEQTVKSNLEKARYNLQKNIEKNVKFVKHEQTL